MDACLLKRKRVFPFPLPHCHPHPIYIFLLIIELQLSKFSGCCFSHPPPYKPHKCPILINHFLSITWPLAEFFSVLRHQGLWCWSALEPSRMTPVGFIMTNTYKFLLCGTYVIFLILSVSALGPKPHPVYGIYFSDGLLLIELSIGRRVIQVMEALSCKKKQHVKWKCA